jgi:hypothetical protein
LLDTEILSDVEPLMTEGQIKLSLAARLFKRRQRSEEPRY